MALNLLKKPKSAPKTAQVPSFYSSLKTITVFVFHEILKTNDHSLLYIEEKGEQDLQEVWFKIYDEYCRHAKVDNSHLKRLSQVYKLREKLADVSYLLELMLCEFPEVVEAAHEVLKSKGYFFRDGQPFEKEYKRLQGQLNILKTKIKIEESKLPKEQKKEAVSLMKQVVALENFFQGRDIDIYTMTMEKWMALVEVGNEKALAQKAMQQNRKGGKK